MHSSGDSAGLKLVEFIVPCYNEADNVFPFHEEFERVFEGSGFDWRLVMVDDGSSDITWEKLEELAARDTRVHAIRFSRNFGKEAAIYAGLNATAGDYVGIIDGDLQQPPQVALDMLAELDGTPQYDCVAAYQEHRREGVAVTFLKSRFYRIFAKAARTDMIADASDFRVFRRSVADALLSMPEYHRFSKGMFAWVGFTTHPHPYVPAERAAGETSWSVRSLFAYAFEGLLSFTTAPLHFITVLGIVSCICAVIYLFVLIIRTIAFGIDLPGYASTISLILMFGGAQLLSIGILGEYLARAFVQGKHRPVYIVKSELNGTPHRAKETELEKP